MWSSQFVYIPRKKYNRFVKQELVFKAARVSEIILLCSWKLTDLSLMIIILSILPSTDVKLIFLKFNIMLLSSF